MKVKKVPMRMCIACHTMKPKKEMLRVVKPKEGDVFIDFTGKAAGTGARISATTRNVSKSCAKGALLNRAFAAEIPPGVYEQIEEDFFAKK